MDDDIDAVGAVCSREDVEAMEVKSSQLFLTANAITVVADDGVITRRNVHCNEKNLPFIEWFYEQIITKSLDDGNLENEERFFMLSGRAGQGKSTLCRKLFLLLTDQERGENPRVQPNFNITMDKDMNAFFTEIQDSTTYIQARKLSSEIGNHKENEDRKFILIDGLDEARSPEVLKNIAHLMKTQKQAVFLISSRSKQGLSSDFRTEIINKKQLNDCLLDNSLPIIPEDNVTFLENLTGEEKTEMYDLLSESENLKSSRLEKLVRNNSKSIQRPADFHILKSPDVNNGVQYYLETARWLLRREMSKDQTDREEMVTSLEFSNLGKGEFDFRQGWYYLSESHKESGDYSKFIDNMKTFNLIEKTDDKRYYLDLSSPSSLGLLICMYTNTNAEKFVRKDYQSTMSKFLFPKPSDEIWYKDLLKMFDWVICNPLTTKGKAHPLYRFATTLLHGSEETYKREMINRLYSRLETEQMTIEESVQLLIFVTDVLHPEDEMEVDSVHVDFDSKHMKVIRTHPKEPTMLFEGSFIEDFSPFFPLLVRFSIIGPGFSASETLEEKQSKYSNESYLHEILNRTTVYGLDHFSETEELMIYRTRIIEIHNQLVEAFRAIKGCSSQAKKVLFESMCYVVLDKNWRANELAKVMLPYCEFPAGIKPDMFLQIGNNGMIVEWWNLIGDLGSENSNKVINHFSNIGLNPLTNSSKKDKARLAAELLYQIEQKTYSERLTSLVKALVMIERVGHYELVKPSLNDPINTIIKKDSKLLGIDLALFEGQVSGYYSTVERFQRQFLTRRRFVQHVPTRLHDTEGSGVGSIFTNYYTNSNDNGFLKAEQFAQILIQTRDLSAEFLRDISIKSVHKWIQNGDFFAALILAIRTGSPEISSILTLCEVESGGHDSLKKRMIGRYLNRTLLDNKVGFDPFESTFWKSMFGSFVSDLAETPMHLENYTIIDFLQSFTGDYFYSAKFNKPSDLYASGKFQTELQRVDSLKSDNVNVAFIQGILFYNLDSEWRIMLDLEGCPIEVRSDMFDLDVPSVNALFGGKDNKTYDDLKITYENPMYFFAKYKANPKEESKGELDVDIEIDFTHAIFGIEEHFSNFRIRFFKNYFYLERKISQLETLKLNDFIEGDCPVSEICNKCETATAWATNSETFGLTEICNKCNSAWQPVPWKSWVEQGRSFAPYVSSIKSSYYTDVQFYKKAVLPIIFISRMRRDTSAWSGWRRTEINWTEENILHLKMRKEQFCEWLWGNDEQIWKLKMMTDIPTAVVDTLRFGSDKLITSWHVPEQFHNPANMPEIHHKEFLEHLLDDDLLLPGIHCKFESKGEDAECSKCSGTGELSCDVCYGYGESNSEECVECSGTGELGCENGCDEKGLIECPDCDGGRIGCRCCDGSGEGRWITCDNCDGSGEVGCKTCKNSGKKWGYLKNEDGDRVLKLWEKIEVNQRKNRHGGYYPEIYIVDLRGDYSLMLAKPDQKQDDEVSHSLEESDVSMDDQSTTDMNLMSATTRSLAPLYEKLFTKKRVDSDEKIIAIAPSVQKSIMIAGNNHGQSSDYIKIDYVDANVTSGQSNFIYGHKLKITESESAFSEQIEGIVEIIEQRFTGRDMQKVISAFVEFREYYKENCIFASKGWKKDLLTCDTINYRLDNAPNLPSGTRLLRTWGIITADFQIDQFKIDRIHNKIDRVENNLQEFKEQKRVSAGRTNLLELIRDVTTTFGAIDWLPDYQNEFEAIANDIKELLSKIEKEEQNQRKNISKGTKIDFETIRSILVGLDSQRQRFENRKLNQFELLLQELRSEKTDTKPEEFEAIFKQWKSKLKEFSYYFEIDSFNLLFGEIKDAIDAQQHLSEIQKIDLKNYCKQRLRMKIRVLGLSRENYPPEIETHWGEVIGGSLTDEKLEFIGSLVRFDIKIRRRAGAKSLLLTNILLAKDELNGDGKLIEDLKPPSKFPEPLPETTWLNMYMDKNRIIDGEYPSFVMTMFIKPGKKYAFHPSLDVEIPIFNPADDDDEIMVREMHTCTIDIRRDRRKGIFRYYVVDIKPLINSV